MNLKEAKVLITGGNSGIGKATAQLLKEKGAAVCIAGRNENTLKEVANSLGLKYIKADVTIESDITTMVATANEQMGGLNVLVNNAGYGYTSKLIDIDGEKLIDQFKTNILGAALTAKECAKIFIEQESGNIINIGSTASLNGFPSGSPYVASKFALRGMTQSWRNELRPHNIRVMQVNPSEVMTHFFDNKVSHTTDKKVYSEAEKASKLRGEEIAHTIASLLEMDDRGFITEATVFATNPKS